MRQFFQGAVRTLIVVLALSSACVISTTTAAHAQTAAEQKKAGEHFGRGKELFNEGDYQLALVEFERAYKLAPNWRVLFNIGQVKYQLQDYPGAMDALDRYLEEGGSDVPQERRAQVQADIERLRSRVAYLKIEVNEAGATVSIDDREIGVSPLATRVAVSAGRRKVTATADGAPAVSKFVDIAGGDSAEVFLDILRNTVTPPGPTPSPAPEMPAEENSLPWAAWALTAGFGAGALAFGLLALNAASDLDGAKGRPTSKDELEADRDKVLGFSIATDVLLGATVLTAAISVYLTVDAATSDGTDDTSVGIRILPGGVAVEGSF